MYTANSLLALVATLAVSVSAAPALTPRQAAPCFIVGSTALPKEVSDVANVLAPTVTCATTKTIGNVPDVLSGGVSYSSIDFSKSSSSPLQFALDKFATANPLASTDLDAFVRNLDLYTATEAGIRSEGGNLAIKEPKFFLAFQVARIKTAQGVKIDSAGSTVEHLLGKVQKNAGRADKALLGQVEALAKQLA